MVELGERSNIGHFFYPVNSIGCNGHGADRFLVAFVTDVDDLVALAGSDLDLVVDLGNERADGVDDIAPSGFCRGNDLGRRSMGAQHDRAPAGNFVDVIDEDHAMSPKAVDNELVVHDFVIAVHGGVESSNHPGQSLDRHLDASTKAARSA